MKTRKTGGDQQSTGTIPYHPVISSHSCIYTRNGGCRSGGTPKKNGVDPISIGLSAALFSPNYPVAEYPSNTHAPSLYTQAETRRRSRRKRKKTTRQTNSVGPLSFRSNSSSSLVIPTSACGGADRTITLYLRR